MLERVLGRNDDIFKMEDGTQVNGGYVSVLLYFRPWVLKYQIVQKSYSSILFKIKKTEEDCDSEELADITRKVRALMEEKCRVDFEFVDDIPNSPSGKFRYTISEVTA